MYQQRVPSLVDGPVYRKPSRVADAQKDDDVSALNGSRWHTQRGVDGWMRGCCARRELVEEGLDAVAKDPTSRS